MLSWKELKERRLVQIVVSYAVAGWVVLSIFGEVIDRGVLPEIVYRVLLVLYFGGMVAATITGWFHGEKGHQKVTRAEVALLSVVALLTLGATAQTVRGHLRQNALRAAGEAAGSSLNNLAVLYFRDRSRSEDLTHIADGLTESLIDRLSRSQGLTVLTENASELYRGSDLPLDSIARALEVGTIVDGTVEGRSDQVRVEVFLVDGMSGAEIQRETLERPLDDLLQLEDALSEEVALLLGRWLAAEVDLREERGGTEEVLAWTLYQRGERRRKSGWRALDDGDSELFVQEYRAADSLYAEAERADPEWAPPLVQRALLSELLSEVAFRNDPGQALSWLNAGTQYVDRALQLDPRNAEAYLTRGKLSYMKWRMGLLTDARASDQVFEQAIGDLGEARTLDPSLAEAWSLLSVLHSEDADNTNAKLAAQRAYEADEFLQSADEVLFRLYATSYDLEQFRDATKYCDEGRSRFPDHPHFRECSLWLMAAPSSQAPEADPQEAWALLDSYLEGAPPSQVDYLRLKGQILIAGVLGKAGLADSASAVLARSRAPSDLDPEMELLGLEAMVRLHIGMQEEALDLLKVYLTAHPQHREGWQWTSHWWWRPLQQDPEFRSLVEG